MKLSLSIFLALVAYVTAGGAYLKIRGHTPESLLNEYLADNEHTWSEFAALPESDVQRFALLLLALHGAAWPWNILEDCFNGIRDLLGKAKAG